MKLSAFDKWLTHDWREDDPLGDIYQSIGAELLMFMCSCDESGNRGCEIHKEDK